jgi:cytochrome P450
MYRNHDVFPDPEAFKPERWLAEIAKDSWLHFKAFSEGSRGCTWRNITYLEQILVLESLVHRFDFELLSKDWELEHTEVFNC